IAPELTGVTEIVRGDAGDEGRFALGIEHEELRVGPDVGRVGGHEDGDIADDAEAALVSVVLDSLPLTVKEKLPELVGAQGVDTLLSGAGQGSRLAAAQVGRPLRPALA